MIAQGWRAVIFFHRFEQFAFDQHEAPSAAAAWNSAVSSGLARMVEPRLRMDLGYFYSEFVGVHDNYDRYNQFTEREVLPRMISGPDAFYGPDGHLLPVFRVHMDLQKEFAMDLRRLSGLARDLRTRLEAIQSLK